MELAAGAFGIQLKYLDVRDQKDIDPVFRAASNKHADAIIMLNSFVLFSERTLVAKLAAKNRLPAMCPQAEYVEDGGLTTYSVSIPGLVPPCGDLRRQNLKRREARRPAGRTADQVRVRHQSESGETDRPDDSAERAGQGG
jgi:hypothetical protein